MSLCQMPPKFTVSCGSFATAMISGNPSMPFTNGYSTGSPMRRGEREELLGCELLVAEEHHEMVEPRPADLGDGLVGELGGEVDAADLGAERPGERQHLDGAVAVVVHARPDRVVASERNCRRRSTLRTLPEAVRGKSSTIRSSSGHFWRARPMRSSSAVMSRQRDRPGRVREPHDRARVLAEPVVGCGHHGDLGHLRQRADRFLHLRRRDVLAAADDHVLHAVGDREEAVGVDDAHVAAAVPAVGVEGLGGERGIGVAEAEIGTA